MNLTKTRIWGSMLAPGAAPLPGQPREGESTDGDARPPEQARTTSEVREVLAARAAAELAPPEAAQASSAAPALDAQLRISPRTGTRIMNLATLLPGDRRGDELKALLRAEAAAPDPLRSTRILPIEQLALPELARKDARAVAVERPRASEKVDSYGVEQSEHRDAAPPKNLMRLVCVALAAVCAVLWIASALLPPPEAPRAAPPGAVAALPKVPVQPSVPGVVAPAPATAQAVEANGQKVLAAEPSDRRQRAAVDALVHGDEALARSIYEELAQQRPDQLAYAEAARILRMRMNDVR